jgi:hypothetical protein
MRYSVQRAAHNRPVPADHHRWAEPTSVVVASRRQARRTEQPTRLVLRRHQVAHLLPRLQPDTAIIPVACVNAYVNNRSTCRGTTGPTAQFDLRGCVPASGSAHVYEWCSSEPARAQSLQLYTCDDWIGLCARARTSAASNMRRRHAAVHSRPEAAAAAISTFLRTNAPGRQGGNTRLCSCLRAVECARAGKGGSPGANLPSQSRSRLPPLPCRLSPRWVSRARASPHSTPHSERGLRCQRKACEGRSICHIVAHCRKALSPMRAARSQRHSRSTTHSRDVAAHTSRRILANSPRRKRSERLLLGLLDEPSA